ncbi:MAG: UDP-N-acetylmuramoyl-tripeptide--D-alanyl-D-alanine ligase [Candidatus Gastranaerophilales bacterium]|nr:UDP-N-acetylmuramoyl-tripeptide--D-alanyl-D-alanine ligase [Candidatus Gastranaerophilales bacterium]
MVSPYFALKDLINCTNGKLYGSADKLGNFSVSTDTRTLSKNDIYIALKGEKFDGHDFVVKAFECGCQGAVISKNNVDNFKDLLAEGRFFIAVDDTSKAYLKIANFYRKQQNVKIIAITGSSGKTTTKEMVYAVLNSQFNTQKSIKNHNNEIGLCQTLLSIEPETQYCVIEMGMRAQGEVDLLSKYAQPDVAVITNVGPAHIGILGSLENIAKAKCEIVNYLQQDGVLFALDDELIKNNVKTEAKKEFYSLDDVNIISRTSGGSIFNYKDALYRINEFAEFNILNALVAIKIGQYVGMKHDEIQSGLLSFRNVEFRNEVTILDCGATVISDCYNANPFSVEASIKSVSEIYKDKNIIVVFGDMLELGEFEKDYHRKTGEIINNSNVNYFTTVGELAKIAAEQVENKKTKSFSSTEEAVSFLKTIIDKNSLVLLKASRGMRFEEILKGLKDLK